MSQGDSLFDLHGRVAVVNGGSRGLGRAMVLAFAAAGADVVIASRNEQSCGELVKKVRAQTGREAMPAGVHVGHWDALEPLVDSVERFGRLDTGQQRWDVTGLRRRVVNVSEALMDKRD